MAAVRMIFAVALACIVQTSLAEDEIPAIPMMEVSEGLSLPGVPGLQDIVDVLKAWKEDSADLEKKKEKCQKIYDGLTKAADMEHDIFNGVRLFATLCKKALDAEGDAQLKALDEALSKQNYLVKAVKRVSKKLTEVAARQQQMMKAAKEQQAKAAAEAAAKADEDLDADDDDDEEISGDSDDEF
eukprot:TRINITY_DN18087_c0_g1_i1.p1 TRINITY_DN18087_c0_g1~~TRINITY_DN18087_c0_g1_i1.p1  ORF type:complete len:201 (-),score=80.02 TRINITY_DN18087_c0_g1_i1:381-935(-)